MTRGRAAASSAFALCVGSVWAQVTPTPTFERNPIHPTPLVIYGRVSVGAFLADPQEPDFAVVRRGMRSLERSYLGVRGTETLDSGLLAHLQLEHSFNPDDGSALRSEEFFDARATVGLSHRQWGRVDLGLLDQPAWRLILSADPWGGNTVATPGRRAYQPAPGERTRSDAAITYTTPADWDVQFSYQLGKPGFEPDGRHQPGFSLAWTRAPWLIGVGSQAWGSDSRAIPAVVVHDSGNVRISAALTVGRIEGHATRNLFIGASGTAMAIGDPRRHEWRVGLNRFNPGDAEGIGWKFGAGWRYRLSGNVVVLANVAWLKRPRDGHQSAFDVGISYAFARDLRTPQVPR